MKQVYCNKCGKLMDDADVYQNFHIRDTLGYGSKYDEEKLDLWLCNHCLDELIDSCEIHPTTDVPQLPIVILISGKAGSGKDVVAQYLSEYLEENDLPTKITHFADLLKYILTEYLGWDGKKDEDGRTLMQHVGTEIVREKKPDFWVDFIADVLTFFKGAWKYVIIPDTRFPNEISRLKERGFVVTHICVTCPSPRATLTTLQGEHRSEHALDDVVPDWVISNDSTPDELKNKTRQWAEEVLYV